jgi:hypothetical protein
MKHEMLFGSQGKFELCWWKTLFNALDYSSCLAPFPDSWGCIQSLLTCTSFFSLFNPELGTQFPKIHKKCFNEGDVKKILSCKSSLSSVVFLLKFSNCSPKDFPLLKCVFLCPAVTSSSVPKTIPRYIQDEPCLLSPKLNTFLKSIWP